MADWKLWREMSRDSLRAATALEGLSDRNQHGSPEDVYSWLKETAKQIGIEASIHTHLVTQDSNWLYIPVLVKGEHAAEKAATLQRLEDAWREQEPEPYWQLLLIPAAN